MVRLLSKHRWISLWVLRMAIFGGIAFLVTPLLPAQTGNWPMYQNDLQRQAANSDARDRITPRTASGLEAAWNFPTGGAILAEPIVVNNVVYVGSSNGIFRALDATTGELLWMRYLGISPMRGACDPNQLGIASSAFYHQLSPTQAVLYVAGVDADHMDPALAENIYLYALDAATGFPVWRQSVGDPRQGAYSWSSPFIANNKLFYAIGAQGEAGSPGLGASGCPFIQGKLYVFDPLTGAPAPPPNQRVFTEGLGGGIFTTPAVDEATGTIYLTTGNAPVADYRNESEINALLALDWNTLETKGLWQLPGPINGTFDLSSGPIIFPSGIEDGSGPRKLVGVGGRNNVFYVFDADDPANIARGPYWMQQVGDRRGKNARNGEGVVSSAAFVNRALYVAGSDRCFFTGDRGCSTFVPGSVVALDPSSGRIKWRRTTVGRVIGALSGSNQGILYVSSGADSTAPNRFEVLDARDGRVLHQFSAQNRLWSGAAAADSRVYVGSYDGRLYALRLNPDLIIPPDPYSAPTGLDAQPGNQSVTLNWVARSGLESRFLIQRKRHYQGLLWEVLAENVAGTSYQDDTVENANIYEYRVFATFADGNVSGPTNPAIASPSGGVSPFWSHLDISSELPGSADCLAENCSVLKITAGGGDIFGNADQFHYVYRTLGNLNGEITARLTQVPPTSLFTKAGVDIRAASGYDSTDTGAPHLAMFYLPLPGTGLESNFRTTYYGGSAFDSHIPANLPIWLRVRRRGRLMEAYYSSNGTNWVRVGNIIDYGDRLRSGVTAGLSVTAHDEARIAEAVFDNISINLNVPPQPPFNFNVTSRENSIELSWDAAPGASGYRVYRQRNRQGPFELLLFLPEPGSETVTYMDTRVEAHEVYFYRVSAVNDHCDGLCEEFAPNERYGRRTDPTVLNGFTTRDIDTNFGGDADFNPNGQVLSVYAAGRDIFGSADSFRFTYKPLCGDGAVRARILHLDAVDDFSKAGIMIREDDSPGARNIALLWTARRGFHVQWRTNPRGPTSDFGPDIPGSLRMHMQIVRSGFNFKTYLSPDGINWTLVGPPQGVNIGMGTGALQGVAVTSHNNSVGALAQLDGIETGPAPNPADPPLPPGDIIVVGGVRRVFVTWGPACNAVRYNLLRGTRPDDLVPYRSGLTERRFVDRAPDIVVRTPYYYQVVGVNGTGMTGPPSNVDRGQAIEEVDYSGGFTSTGDLTANSTASFTQGVARLTTGAGNQAGTFFTNSHLLINGFITAFTFQIYGGSSPRADGLTFIIQGNGPTAVGPGGGGLAYGSDSPTGDQGIRNSLAIKFDIYSNAGEGTNSTGIFTDGRSPTVRQGGLPASIPDRTVSLGGTGIDLNNTNDKEVIIGYDGVTLVQIITDLVTRASTTLSYEVDIPAFVGGDTAFVGFGGGTGGLTAVQDIKTWVFYESKGSERSR